MREDYMIVTPEQLADGYVVDGAPAGTASGHPVRQEFVVVKMLDDGNYLVREPGGGS